MVDPALEYVKSLEEITTELIEVQTAPAMTRSIVYTDEFNEWQEKVRKVAEKAALVIQETEKYRAAAEMQATQTFEAIFASLTLIEQSLVIIQESIVKLNEDMQTHRHDGGA